MKTDQPLNAFIITISGKGGVGKTSLTALLIDEIARAGYPGPLLAVDGDPATTLHFALGLEPPEATVADIRDSLRLDAGTVRALPPGVLPTDHVREALLAAHVIRPAVLRRMRLDLLALGRSEGRGCYCAVNKALAAVLPDLADAYPLMVIDNDAGTEHLSRYRLHRADRFVVVFTPTRAARAVRARILKTAAAVGMETGQIVSILNRHPESKPACGAGLITIADSSAITTRNRADRPVIQLPDGHPARAALAPLVKDALGYNGAAR